MNGSAGDHEDMLDLVSVAALGSLGRDELAVVSLHLVGCDGCRAEYAALRETATAIGLTAESDVEEVRSAQILERLHAAMAAPVRRSRRVAPQVWVAWFAAAAAFVFAISSLGIVRALRGEIVQRDALLGNSNARIAATEAQAARDRLRSAEVLAADAKANASLRARLAIREHGIAQRSAQFNAADKRADDAGAAIPSEQTRVDLTASDAKRYPIGFGTIIRRGGNLYVALTALPPLAEGKVYETWTVMKGGKSLLRGLKLMPSVTFTPSREGSNVVRLPVAANRVIAVAVTIEPKGGSRHPSGKFLFVRTLS